MYPEHLPGVSGAVSLALLGPRLHEPSAAGQTCGVCLPGIQGCPPPRLPQVARAELTADRIHGAKLNKVRNRRKPVLQSHRIIYPAFQCARSGSARSAFSILRSDGIIGSCVRFDNNL